MYLVLSVKFIGHLTLASYPRVKVISVCKHSRNVSRKQFLNWMRWQQLTTSQGWLFQRSHWKSQRSRARIFKLTLYEWNLWRTQCFCVGALELVTSRGDWRWVTQFCLGALTGWLCGFHRTFDLTHIRQLYMWTVCTLLTQMKSPFKYEQQQISWQLYPHIRYQPSMDFKEVDNLVLRKLTV